MVNVKTVKWIGLVGAALSSVSLVMSGHVNEAIGIMMAALSSAGVVTPNA